MPDYEYDNDHLLRAWQLLLQGYTSAESHHRELTYDLVNVGRQLLGNRFMELRDVLTKAYEDKDLDQVSAVGQQMKELMDDYASLLTYEPTLRSVSGSEMRGTMAHTVRQRLTTTSEMHAASSLYGGSRVVS